MSEVLLMNSRSEKPAAWSSTSAEVAALNKIAGRISSVLPIDELLREVVDLLTVQTHCDSCLVYFVENDELVLRASSDSGPGRADRVSLKQEQGTLNWAIAQRESLAIAQCAYSDPRVALFHDISRERHEAILSVPMLSAGRILGVITLQNRAPYQYTRREASLTAALGFLLAARLERMRLETENAALTARLQSRKLVERAKGVLQREMKISEEAAHRAMQQESQHMGKSLREIAEAVLLTDNLRRCAQ